MNTENAHGVEKLLKDLHRHLETRLEYTRLVMVEKTAIALSRVISFGVIAALGFIFILLFSIAAGIWLGDCLGSLCKGFIVVSAFYFIIILILLVFRKRWVEKKLVDTFISLFLADLSNGKD